MRSPLPGAIVTAAAPLIATCAAAGDLCFNSTSPPNPAPADNPDILVVLPGVEIPGKGK